MKRASERRAASVRLLSQNLDTLLLLKKNTAAPKPTGKYQVSAKVTFLIVAYSVCSSMLLILNKVAVTYLPAPSFILLAQLSSCAVFIRLLASAGIVECEKLEKTKAKKFALIGPGSRRTRRRIRPPRRRTPPRRRGNWRRSASAPRARGGAPGRRAAAGRSAGWSWHS